MNSVSALKGFDASQYLESIEGIKIFLNDASEANNPKCIARAIGAAAKAIGKRESMKIARTDREKHFRALYEK